jgi:hypothetical protein
MIGCALSDKWDENRRSHLQSLAHCGRTAARLAVGAMLMFCVAAIPKGGFSQFVQSTPPQLGIRVVCALYLKCRSGEYGLWISEHLKSIANPDPSVPSKTSQRT